MIHHHNDGSIRAIDREPTNPMLALAGLKPPEWTERALCAQIDSELFFPEKGGNTSQAKSVCRRCTVSAECLDWALEHQERFGIWGGLSERERRRLYASLDITPITTNRAEPAHGFDTNLQGPA